MLQFALKKQFDVDTPLNTALANFRAQFKEKSISEKVFNPYHLQHLFELYNSEIAAEFANSFEKSNLFWRQVVGWVQSYLPACYAQAFAHSLSDLINNNYRLDTRSFNFRNDWRYFFPLADSSGLGFDYGAAVNGRLAGQWLTDDAERKFGGGCAEAFSKIVSNKNTKLASMVKASYGSAITTHKP